MKHYFKEDRYPIRMNTYSTSTHFKHASIIKHQFCTSVLYFSFTQNSNFMCIFELEHDLFTVLPPSTIYVRLSGKRCDPGL